MPALPCSTLTNTITKTHKEGFRMAQAVAIVILALLGIGLLKLLSPTGKATDAVKIGVQQ